MMKNIVKLTCFFAFILFVMVAVNTETVKSEEPQKTNSIPAIISLLMDDVTTPEPPDDIPLPDTGQDKCYNNEVEITCPTNAQNDFFGQDAQYPRISRSYTKLGQDGAELEDNASHIDAGGGWIMTRDNVTGLIWEIKTTANKNAKYTWSETEDFIDQLNINGGGFGGFNDWRLPSRAELSTLSDRSIDDPAIDPFWFPNTVSWRYWSSTSVANKPDNAWRVNAAIGFVYYQNKENWEYHVRGVRGPAFGNNFVDNNDGTVTDTINGLMWKKCSYGQQWDAATESCTGTAERLTWQEALANAAEENDWRLPNINELQTLVDDSASDPAIYGPFGQHLPPALVSPDPIRDFTLPYWSSTTDIRFSPDFNRAWLVNFVDGSNNYDGYSGSHGVKTLEFFVRLVRPVK